MAGATIAVASDHAGFDLKEILKSDLQAQGTLCSTSAPTRPPRSTIPITAGHGRGDCRGKAERGVWSAVPASASRSRQPQPQVRAVLAHDTTRPACRASTTTQRRGLRPALIGVEVAREALKVSSTRRSKAAAMPAASPSFPECKS
jgi:ribose 5-phosphate isomerase B